MRMHNIPMRLLAVLALAAPAAAWSHPCFHQGTPVFCPNFPTGHPMAGQPIPDGSETTTLTSGNFRRWRLPGGTFIFIEGTMHTAFFPPVTAPPPPVVPPSPVPFGPQPPSAVREMIALGGPNATASPGGARQPKELPSLISAREEENFMDLIGGLGVTTGGEREKELRAERWARAVQREIAERGMKPGPGEDPEKFFDTMSRRLWETGALDTPTSPRSWWPGWTIAPEPQGDGAAETRDFILAAPSNTPQSRTHVIPHFFESKGRAGTEFSFDFHFTAASASGQAGIAGAGETGVEIFVFDEKPGPPKPGAPSVCPAGSCPELLSTGQKLALTLDQLAGSNAGGLKGAGFDRSTMLGYAIVTVEGGNDAETPLLLFVTNSHTSAFDLSVLGFQPEPLSHLEDRNAATGASQPSEPSVEELRFTPENSVQLVVPERIIAPLLERSANTPSPEKVARPASASAAPRDEARIALDLASTNEANRERGKTALQGVGENAKQRIVALLGRSHVSAMQALSDALHYTEVARRFARPVM